MSTNTLERRIEALPHCSNGQWARADVLFPELEVQAREQAAKRIAGIALQETCAVELIPEKEPQTTLLAALQQAAAGDETARNLVRVNVATDHSERLFKSKNQIDVTFDIVDNKLYQNGCRNTAIQENTFMFGDLNPTMEMRSISELGNAELFDSLIEQGILEHFDALVASPTPKDKATREAYNWFTDTDTMSLQLLSQEDETTAKLESAFVAGKTSIDGGRHDLDAIKMVALENGVDILDASEDSLLKFVMLIPKGSLEHGVTSVVMQYDGAAGGTFYGEAEPQQDYQAFAQMCRERTFDEAVDAITDRLIAEVATFRNPLDANKRLDELSGSKGIEEAVVNPDINPRIFGEKAAYFIQGARYSLEMNNAQHTQAMIRKAQAVESSSSCPFKNDKKITEFRLEDGVPDELSPQETSDVLEDCEFVSKECPKCGEKDVRTVCKDGKFYGDCGCESD